MLRTRTRRRKHDPTRKDDARKVSHSRVACSCPKRAAEPAEQVRLTFLVQKRRPCAGSVAGGNCLRKNPQAEKRKLLAAERS